MWPFEVVRCALDASRTSGAPGDVRCWSAFLCVWTPYCNRGGVVRYYMETSCPVEVLVIEMTQPPRQHDRRGGHICHRLTGISHEKWYRSRAGRHSMPIPKRPLTVEIGACKVQAIWEGIRRRYDERVWREGIRRGDWESPSVTSGLRGMDFIHPRLKL